MYVTRVPNRGSPPAVLLRASYREGDKVKNRTLANLSRWPADKVEALERVLKGLAPRVELADAFEISRTLPHGAVAAALGTAWSLHLDHLIDTEPSRMRNLALALVVARVTEPASKLAIARGLSDETATSSLGTLLSVSSADEDDLYDAMDWLLKRQERVEDALAKRHLDDGTLVLYDVSSAAFEGVTCPIARIGYARDGVKGRLQIVYGLLTNKQGIPVATEVFEGNTGDPSTLAPQIDKVKRRFRLTHVVFVGDRGMLTKARIAEELDGSGLDWITALKAPAIKALVAGDLLQPSLFDDVNLGEIVSPDYPGERLVVCKNPYLAQERRVKRADLLAATERELNKIQAACARKRRPLKGEAAIGVRVGKVIGRYKMAKHFIIEISAHSLSFAKNEEHIAQEAALDGFYVLRTNVGEDALSASDVVGAYKSLANVERAFRVYNTELDIRPIRHRKPERVRAHVLLCMLAHYLQWHMTARLAPILFVDDDKPAALAQRVNPVEPAMRSPAAKAKARRKRTASDEPVHSFTSLLADLRTLAVNRIQPADPDLRPFNVLTTPTSLQRRAFELLGVSWRLGQLP
jgi:hypothetical protein